MAEQPIVLVGCGRMGGAILRGLKGEREIYVIDPGLSEAPAGATLLAGPADLSRLTHGATILLAVKPQMTAALLPQLGPYAGPDTVFVSIIAGVAIDTFRDGLGSAARVVRAMPNTPAAVLQGVTAAVPGPGVDAAQRAAVDALLGAIGEVVWLEDEAMIDVVTAVSGSGPAYFFRFAEALAEAGKALGLPAGVAERLARRTFEGAGALSASTERSLAELRIEVTSPNGTTAAALAEFDRDGRLGALVGEAASAAARRSVTLAAEVKAALG